MVQRLYGLTRPCSAIPVEQLGPKPSADGKPEFIETILLQPSREDESASYTWDLTDKELVRMKADLGLKSDDIDLQRLRFVAQSSLPAATPPGPGLGFLGSPARGPSARAEPSENEAALQRLKCIWRNRLCS